MLLPMPHSTQAGRLELGVLFSWLGSTRVFCQTTKNLSFSHGKLES
jgi:hypothetical protein